MTTPLSQDLRRRIVRAVEKGSSIHQAAARYEVSPSAAVKLMRRLRETGSTKPDGVGGHLRPVLEPHQDLLRSLVDAKSSITTKVIDGDLLMLGSCSLVGARRDAAPSRHEPHPAASRQAKGR
jgi:transposase